MTPTTLLAISGSLRARSLNTEVLRAAALVAPGSVQVPLYRGLAELPPFNPDLDQGAAAVPPAVRSFRAEVDAADGLLICSPEYAHGVPGTLKNALDWLVSGSEIVQKPVGLVNASPRSTHAHASLAETLRTMSTILVPGASITLPLHGRRLVAAEIAAEPRLAVPLRAGIGALIDAVPAYHAWRASLSLSASGTGGSLTAAEAPTVR
jgi:chromate reductase